MSSEIPHENLIKGIELGINENYSEARILFSAYSEKYPNEAEPHFYLATLWQSQMMDFETQVWEDSFRTEIDKTIQLCELSDEHQLADDLTHFYFASALAYKSFHISRQGRYITGIRLGLQAMDKLNQVVAADSSFFDAYLGIGSYLYWRSYLTRNFDWLPFFSDQREKGIALIQKAYAQGTISKWAALSNLAWIFIKEERFDEAIDCAQTGLTDFPKSRFFLWPLGDAQFLNMDFTGALETYHLILESVTSESFNNRYNETVLHLKIAHCLFELGDLANA